jgi:hypothetical protein
LVTTQLRVTKASDLPEIVPDKENQLSLVEYSSIIETLIRVKGSLVSPLPEDEKKSIVVQFGLEFQRFLSRTFSSFLDLSYSLSSPDEVKQTFFEKIGKGIEGIVSQPSFDESLFDLNKGILNGPFFGILIKEGKHYVIDSRFMTKYEYKSGLLAPSVKAVFEFKQGSLVWKHIEHNGKTCLPQTPEFELGERLMYNYLLIDTIVNKRLLASHLKVPKAGAYAVRKFMSAQNRLKQFLYNFTYGSISIMNVADLFLGKGYGNGIKYFPFTEKGLIDYTNDSIEEDHTSTYFPEVNYPCGVLEDCVTVYNIYKKYVSRVISILDETEKKECLEVVNFLQNEVKEYKYKSCVEILASFMYVTSVVHTLKTNVLEYVTQGYRCPVSVNSNGTIPKYAYLTAIPFVLVTTIPMRKLFVKLPAVYSSQAKTIYNDMCSDLKAAKFSEVDINKIDSSAQI